MRSRFRNKIHEEWAISIIVLLSFLLRIWKINFQSLWFDELYSLNEAAPYKSWTDLINYIKCCDQHPPLYLALEKICFLAFGHTQFVARMPSVLAGTASVWAIWLLGKEIGGRRIGIIAAILCCVNFYNIYYSQEARDYIFAFLFCSLSFVYFLKLIKAANWKYIFPYSLFTLLLLYSHYYSLFVITAQGFLVILFFFLDKPERRIQFIKPFLLSGLIIGIGYLPCLPFLLSITKIKSFWIEKIPSNFLLSFLNEYFGNADLVKPVVYGLLIFYFAMVIVSISKSAPTPIKGSPARFGILVLSVWLTAVYLIPYVRSILVVPMLFPRYTIVALPAVLIMLAFGIDYFRFAWLRFIILALFVTLSLVDLIKVKDYYGTVKKTPYREMDAFMARENTGNYPLVINQFSMMQQDYYFRNDGFNATRIVGIEDNSIDSIVKSSAPAYNVDGFWIQGHLSDAKQKELDTSYTLLKRATYHDAVASLYQRKSKIPANLKIISYTDILPGEGATVLPDENRTAFWGGTMHLKPVQLTKGRYRFGLMGIGTVAKEIYPHLKIFVNDQKVGDYFINGDLGFNSFPFEVREADSVVVKITMDNDFSDPGKGDRNAFFQYFLIEQIRAY